MASITINIPDGVVDRVLDAFVASYGWKGPELKAAFTRRKIMEYIKEVTVSYERKLAGDNAAAIAESAAKTDISIT